MGQSMAAREMEETTEEMPTCELVEESCGVLQHRWAACGHEDMSKASKLYKTRARSSRNYLFGHIFMKLNDTFWQNLSP